MRLSKERRELFALAEARAREAAGRVAEGEIPHYRQMDLMAIGRRAAENLEQLLAAAADERALMLEQIDQAAADVVNYICYLRVRLLETVSQGPGIPETPFIPHSDGGR
jgi:hypothetical protein